MKIQKISHKTLAETAAGKLAASLLDGSLAQGAQLPPERELMNQLGISRATLREALKTLEENHLIEFATQCRLVRAQDRRVEHYPGKGIGERCETRLEVPFGDERAADGTTPHPGLARKADPHPESAKGPAGYV